MVATRLFVVCSPVGWYRRVLIFAAQSIIVPVPLHPWRRIRRRFNQSALLATEIARLTGLPHDPLSLVRVKRTPSQGGLAGKRAS